MNVLSNPHLRHVVRIAVAYVLIVALGACDVSVFRSSPYERSKLFTVERPSAGAYRFGVYSAMGKWVLLPSPTLPGMSVPLYTVRNTDAGWVTKPTKAVVPGGASLICVKDEAAFYAVQDRRAMRLNLWSGEATLLSEDARVTLSCDILNMMERDEENCADGSIKMEFPISAEFGLLVVCQLPEDDGVEIRRLAPDGGASQIDIIDRGPWFNRGHYLVRYLPWRSAVLFHGGYMHKEKVGVFNANGWVRSYNTLPEGKWSKHHFAGGRPGLEVFRPAQPMVIWSTRGAGAGSLWIVNENGADVIRDVPSSIRIEQDGCGGVFIREKEAGGKKILEGRRIRWCEDAMK